MRTLLFATALLLLAACKGKSDKKATDKDSSNAPAPVVTEPAKSDTSFFAFGGHPFWDIYVIPGQKIQFVSGGELPDTEVPYVEPVTVDSITTRYTSAKDKDTIVLTITKKECVDFLNNKNAFSVTAKVNRGTFEGCGKQ